MSEAAYNQGMNISLKNTLALVSANIVLAVSDPALYIKKVGQKVSMPSSVSDFLLKLAIGAAGRETYQMVSLGEISASLNLLEKEEGIARVKTWGLRKNLAGIVGNFSTTIKEGKRNRGQDCQTDGESIRVLAYVTNSFPFTSSGYAIRTHESLKAMRMSGVDVSAATRYGYPFVVGKIASSDCQVIDEIPYYRLYSTFPPLKLEQQREIAVNQLTALAKELRTQVLITTTGFENALVVSRVAAILNIPWVYELRGEPEQTWLSTVPPQHKAQASKSEYFQKSRIQEENAIVKASAVTVLSSLSGSRAHQLGAQRVAFVPNAIDRKWVELGDQLSVEGTLECQRTRAREHLAISEFCDGALVVGAITSVVSYEGLEILLESIKILRESSGKNSRVVKVIIVGDGNELPNLKQLAQDLEIEDLVLLPGKQPTSQISSWYLALDCFVIPRKNEAVCRNVTPIKGLMAQALGIPIISSDLPALREVTGGFATYVSAEDPQALSEVISQFDQYSSQSPLERSWIKLRTWDSVGEKYCALFKALV